MRIGMMADFYTPYISGVTHYIQLTKNILTEMGHEVFVFTFGVRGYHETDPWVIRSPGLSIRNTGYSFGLRYTREAKILVKTMDVIHVHHPFLSGQLAIRYGKPSHIPIVFTSHTRYDLYSKIYLPILFPSVSEEVLKTYLELFCNRVDQVISPSAGMALVLRDLHVDVPVHVIPNGIDVDRFKIINPLISRDQLGFSHNHILLIYHGRVAREKNIPFLLQAFCEVIKIVPTLRLLIIGGGDSQREIQDLVVELSLKDQVKIMGQISYSDIPSYLHLADIFVSPSTSEVHPLSVIEAMAAGLPVVGIVSPGISDTVINDVTGYLADNELRSFSQAILRLTVDSEKRNQMKTSALKLVEKYSIRRTTQELIDTYKEVISRTILEEGIKPT